MLSKILKNLSLLYAFLLMLGYIYLHTYYEAFNIDIYSFLTTNEILLIFLNLIYPILSFLIIFLVAIVSCLIFYRILEWLGIIVSIALKKIRKSLSINESTVKHTKKTFIHFTLGFSIILSSSLMIYVLSKVAGYWGVGSMLIPIAYYFIYYQIRKIKTFPNWYLNFRISKTSFDIISFIFFFILMTWYYGVAKAELIKKHSYNLSFNEVSIKYENKRIIPNDSLIYLGSTNKYFFYRDLKESISKVYSIDKVDNILVGSDYEMSRINSDAFFENLIKNWKFNLPNPKRNFDVKTNLKDCSEIHEGEFSLGKYIIKRDKNYQTEYGGFYKGKINQLKIVWKSSCEYYLFDKNDVLENSLIITSITDSTYTQLSAIDSLSYLVKRLKH